MANPSSTLLSTTTSAPVSPNCQNLEDQFLLDHEKHVSQEYRVSTCFFFFCLSVGDVCKWLKRGKGVPGGGTAFPYLPLELAAGGRRIRGSPTADIDDPSPPFARHGRAACREGLCLKYTVSWDEPISQVHSSSPRYLVKLFTHQLPLPP